MPRLLGRVIPGMMVKRGTPSLRLRGEVRLLGERDLDVAVGAVGRRASEGAALGAVGVDSRRSAAASRRRSRSAGDRSGSRRPADRRPGAMPSRSSCAAGPMPESSKRRGESNAPAQRITSPAAIVSGAVVALDDDAASVGAVHRQPENPGVGLEMQVRSIQHRRDEGAVGVEPLAVGDRRLVPAGAVERAAVERSGCAETRPGSPPRPSPRRADCADAAPPGAATSPARRTSCADAIPTPSRGTRSRPSRRNPTRRRAGRPCR